MKISEMIDLMGILGIGEVNSAEEKATALKYLNLANAELYVRSFACNYNLFKKISTTSIPNQSYIELPVTPNNIYRVLLPTLKIALKPKTLLELSDLSFQRSPEGRPEFFAWSKKVIDFYPLQTGVAYPIDIVFQKSMEPLTEVTNEDDIPYPLQYHQLLVDGGLYWLSQSEGGFKSSQKIIDASNRWKIGKDDVATYFWSASPNKINTYSSI